jgi:hypothetical protein
MRQRRQRASIRHSGRLTGPLYCGKIWFSRRLILHNVFNTRSIFHHPFHIANRATDPERIALSFSFDSGEHPMLVEMAVGIKMDIVPTNLAAQANGLRSQSSIGSTSVRLTQYADG